MTEPPECAARGRNTTLVCICTDAALDKRECGMVARTASGRHRPRGRPDLHARRRRRRRSAWRRASRRGPVPSPRCRWAPRRRPSPPPRSATECGKQPSISRGPSGPWPSGRSAREGVPGSIKTEAVVLRSIRYGEADRILHLYSATRGRIGAIAKGSRRPRSRFGGRLEPFFRLDLVLHEGRGDLLHGDRRLDRGRLLAAAQRRAGADGGRRAPATRCCGCSTTASRTSPPTTCSAATWRCSTPVRPTGAAEPRPGARLPPEAGAGGRLRRPSSPPARAAARPST